MNQFEHIKWKARRGDKGDDIFVFRVEGHQNTLERSIKTPMYSIHFLVRGTMEMRINNVLHRIEAPAGILTPTDCISSQPNGSEDCIVYGIALSVSFAKLVAMDAPRAQMAMLSVHPMWQMTQEKMDMVIEYIKLLRKVINEPNIRIPVTLVQSVFYLISDDFEHKIKQQNTSIPRYEELTGQFLTLIEDQCSAHHQLDWYASQLYLTTGYVANVIKQTLGKSAGQCLEEAIMRQSQSLLKTTDLSVQEVASMMGFNNQSHFGTFFRRKTGMSPKQYRAQKTEA